MILDTNAVSDLFQGNAELAPITGKRWFPATTPARHCPWRIPLRFRELEIQKETNDTSGSSGKKNSIVLCVDAETANASVRHKLKKQETPHSRKRRLDRSLGHSTQPPHRHPGWRFSTCSGSKNTKLVVFEGRVQPRTMWMSAREVRLCFSVQKMAFTECATTMDAKQKLLTRGIST